MSGHRFGVYTDIANLFNTGVGDDAASARSQHDYPGRDGAVRCADRRPARSSGDVRRPLDVLESAEKARYPLPRIALAAADNTRLG